jgi:FtsH-binding integral membrane protein
MAAPLEHAMQLEVTVARERFRSRIFRLAALSIAVDAGAAVVAYLAERGAPHAFSSIWAALFWTTTQLLTVSSQLPNPERVVTKFLDVALELYAIVVVTSLAATFTDLLHHRTRRHVRERQIAAAAAPDPND